MEFQMIKYINDSFEFFKFVVSYKELGKVVTKYVDNIDKVREQVHMNPHIYSRFRSEVFNPTTDQLERLNEINKLMIDFKENYIEDFNLYVKQGVMLNQDPLLGEIFSKAKFNNKIFLIGILAPIIKQIRVEKSEGGFEMYGRRFASDAMARDNVLGYISKALKDKLYLNIPFPIEEPKYIWKDLDNKFAPLTFAQLSDLSDRLLLHIQASFSAEALTAEALMKMEVVDLVKFNATARFDRIGKKVKYETDPNYQYSELEPIFESAFDKSIKYLMSVEEAKKKSAGIK